ncbi:MAG: DUF4350 domain-containing protein [Bacteroidota bacterium]
MKGGIRNIIIGILIVVALLALLAGVIGNTQGPKDWRPSYSRKALRAFGSKLLFERLGDIYQTDTVKVLEWGPFDDLVLKQYTDHLLVIIGNKFYPESYELEELNRFVFEGNDVLLVAEALSSDLLEELGLYTKEVSGSLRDSLFLTVNSSGNAYSVSAKHASSRITSWDSETSLLISTSSPDQASCIRVQYGRGAYYISTHPLLFTNYYMVQPQGAAYLEEILSALPANRKILWDSLYKPERIQNKKAPDRNRAGGVWGYLMSHEALRWATYIILFAGAFFMFFGAKRLQRIVPVMKPLRNTTLEFTETIGRLYLFEKRSLSMEEKHLAIAEKKIKAFLDFIRRKYNLKTHRLDENFKRSLAARTGIDEKELKPLLRRIKQVQQQDALLEESLIELNEEIENFYTRTGRKETI